MASRVLTRLSIGAISARHCLTSGSAPQGPLRSVSNGFHSLSEWNSTSLPKFFPCEITMQKECLYHASAGIQRRLSSSSASPQPTDKDSSQTNVNLDDLSGDRNQVESTETNANSCAPEQAEDVSRPASKEYEPQSRKRRRRGAKRTAFSDSDTELELSKDDLVKLVQEKKELLKVKHHEFEKMQLEVCRSYDEMENILIRAKCEVETAKAFAIQNFAKSLLDVADNLWRVSLVVKKGFLKIYSSEDLAGAVPLLKTLLEGVEMTDKQLADVLKKVGVERYDPINEHFDPHLHNAVFQVPDSSEPSGTVSTVLKPGYMRHNSVFRYAEVGVAQASAAATQ